MDSAGRLRRKLGEFTFEVWGHRIRAVRPPGKIPTRPRWYDPRIAVFFGTWDVWRDLYEPLCRSCVRDWDELEWFDLWADPMVGMRFIRELSRGR